MQITISDQTRTQIFTISNQASSIRVSALVKIVDAKPMTDSYIVADAFERRHSDVLRSIQNMRCSKEFRERNFAFTVENKRIGSVKRDIGFYRMTRDGWMFLVMGFTGEKADLVKEQFIEAFNEMFNFINRSFTQLDELISEYLNAKQAASVSGKALAHWKYNAPKIKIDSIFQHAQLKLDLQI